MFQKATIKKLEFSKTNLLQAGHCTLHAADSTVHTAPEHVPAPVHFILHIEHCTVHTTHLYCMLHAYQDLAEFELKVVAAK